MEHLPLVSIITVVYNGEKYIEDVIRNVLKQSYNNIEYIIIDGGSTDNTVSIIKKYEKQISAWISEKDKGISDAFNKGIMRSNGEIIGIINSDDWYEDNAVEQVVKNIENADIVYGDMQLWKEKEKDFLVKGDHHFLTREMTVNHPTVFVRKESYSRLGLFDTRYELAMDYDLMLRFMVNKARFKYIPVVLANMRWEGLSDTKWLKGCRETLSIKNKYLSKRKLLNYLYFYKHVFAIAISKLLRRTRTDFLIKSYRSKYAKVKKIYE
ncbi:MAG TPA: glycosyltransferase family 2 protein [Chitinophagaceae bacterium]|nr:glycosyltransferase family 2 protein [Chitinophagaceae bacterium]